MKDFISLFAQTLLSVFVIIAAPVIGVILLVWWIVAGIVGVVFPKVNLFPLGRMFRKASKWMEAHTGEDLSAYRIVFSLFLMFFQGFRKIRKLIR